MIDRTAGRPLKVLFINESIGGHATVHHGLRLALASRRDVDPTFLDVPPSAGVVRLAGARIPGLARLDLDLQPLRAQLARSAWLDRRLARPLAGVDAVHLYTHNAGLLSVRRWRDMPTVVSLDTTNAQNAYRLPTRRPTRFTPLTVAATKPWEQRVYRSATRVVANSEWAASSVRDDYGIAADRLRVLPFGIDAPRFEEGPAPGARTTVDRPRLIFVGRSLDRKGGRQLLEVHQRHFAERADLTLVTQQPVAARPGVEVVDDLQPGSPRLWDLLRASSIFVFPSEIDMAPNAVLEAMMAGLPIVARPVGAIPEMVVDGENGILVGADDDELAAAIGHLLDHRDERARMGAASRRRAIDSYRVADSTEALIETLRAAVADHRSSSTRMEGRNTPPASTT